MLRVQPRVWESQTTGPASLPARTMNLDVQPHCSTAAFAAVSPPGWTAPRAFGVVIAGLKWYLEDCCCYIQPWVVTNPERLPQVLLLGTAGDQLWFLKRNKISLIDMRLRHELYIKPVITHQQVVMTAIHRLTMPEITTTNLDMLRIARKILLFKTQEQE